jgi:pimeloyl-ACP methyl ester carboxylesterase
MTRMLEPPSPNGLFREARGFLELPRLLFRAVDLVLQPRGRGQPILILPGYGAGDGSTAILKSYLRVLGYRASGWRLGRNSGNTPELLPRVMRRLLSIHRHTQERVRLIGWSFGGFLAREAARERPDLVHQVITLGTPVVGGPKYTVLAHSFRRRGIDLDAMEAEIASRNAILLRTPVTALYSRIDGIVAWQACIDSDGHNVEHVEVRTTHLGFGFSPQVFKIIAQRLADQTAELCPAAPSRESLRQERRRRRENL